jgi:hypothetical protein
VLILYVLVFLDVPIYYLFMCSTAISYVAKGISKCFNSCSKEGQGNQEPLKSGTCTQQPARCRVRSKEEKKLDEAYRNMDDYEWGG